MGKGRRSWRVICPYCGDSYTLTNWMTRNNPVMRDENGRLLSNTHERACYKKYVTKKAGEDE